MVAYRIADARHPIFDGNGVMLRGGRWNSVGQRVIYAAESYAGAMLEILVHANLAVPPENPAGSVKRSQVAEVARLDRKKRLQDGAVLLKRVS